MTLYNPDRHEALQTKIWTLTQAKQVISAFVELAIGAFQGEQLWRAHPNIRKEYQL